MKALRWHGRGDVRLDDVPEPRPEGATDALIEVSLCGICGTDISEVRSGPGMISLRPHPLSGQAAPVTLGHELVGTLLEGSSPDGAIEPGDRVTVDACWRCGTCPACLRGDYHLCPRSGAIGLHSDGGFAPLVAVPSYTLVAVPDAVDDRQAAQTEPFAVALHALERAATGAGDSVLVLGFGPIGAASALLARALGAFPHVVELDEARRARAEELGLATIEAGEELPRRVRRTLGGGGAEVVVESTGVAALASVAIECATRGGRVAMVGLPSTPSEIDTRRLTLFERSLVGSLGYRHDLPRVLDLVAAGDVDPAPLAEATIGLDQAAEELTRLAASPGGSIKTLVEVRE